MSCEGGTELSIGAQKVRLAIPPSLIIPGKDDKWDGMALLDGVSIGEYYLLTH